MRERLLCGFYQGGLPYLAQPQSTGPTGIPANLQQSGPPLLPGQALQGVFL